MKRWHTLDSKCDTERVFSAPESSEGWLLRSFVMLRAKCMRVGGSVDDLRRRAPSSVAPVSGW